MKHDAVASPRLTTVLLGVFAAVALVITATGIGGMLALSVSQRRQEFGVRMALGATAGNVQRMVLREGFSLVLSGLAIGFLGVTWLTQVLTGLLFGIRPDDPPTIVGVVIAILALAWLSCYIPARRVTSIYPMVALR